MRSILLIEDNPTDELLALRAFKRAGIDNRIVVARDGEEALGRLDEELPSLVLLDLGLPKISGLHVLRRIRTQDRTRTLPVVIFTSSDEPRDIRDSYGLGANAYVRKPGDYHALIEVAKTIAAFWLVLNELPGD